MRVVSWNVNGLRSVAAKGFASWLESSGADVVGLQETRARESAVRRVGDYTCWSAAADMRGSGGVEAWVHDSLRPAQDTATVLLSTSRSLVLRLHTLVGWLGVMVHVLLVVRVA